MFFFFFALNFLINFHFRIVCELSITQNVFLFNLGANEQSVDVDIDIKGPFILGGEGGCGVVDDNEVQEVDMLVSFTGFELIITDTHLLFRFLFSAALKCI